MDWRAEAVSAETSEEPSSLEPPETRDGLRFSMLDLLMPANSMKDRTLQIATFKPMKGEPVAEYALRFRPVIKRFDAAADCAGKGGTP